MRIPTLIFLLITAVLGLIALAAGCGPAPQAVLPTATATSTEQATPVPTATPSQTPTPDGQAQAVQEAKADLAARLQISPQEISVVKTEQVEWPDASLGCPEPGRMYAEVITPGHVIILSAGGKTYEYHRPEGGGEALLCTQKGDRPVSSVKVPTEAEEIVALARAHLADRIGVSASEITVTEIEAVEWRDSSLGCPEPGKMYLQVITPGLRLTLEAGGVKYEYHSDRGRRVIPCQGARKGLPFTGATPEPKSPVEMARLDLAQREGVAPEDIEVVSVEDVDWPDASLGCPQPGMMYAQVITPGKRVVLAIGDAQYEYHTHMGKRVVLCQPNQ